MMEEEMQELRLNKSTGTGKHSMKDRLNDFYQTPSIAVESLLRNVNLPEHLWEPACGAGAIVSPLRSMGHIVYASDLYDNGCPESSHGIDFLNVSATACDTIVTNPPFSLANQFVRHALALCPNVIMLLRLAFLESEGRSDILDGGRLKMVMPFKRRLPMMNRHGWTGPRNSSAMAFAWFQWGPEGSKLPQIKRI